MGQDVGRTAKVRGYWDEEGRSQGDANQLPNKQVCGKELVGAEKSRPCSFANTWNPLCFTAQDSGDANQKSFRVLVQGSGADEASMPVQQTLYQLTTCKAPENDS